MALYQRHEPEKSLLYQLVWRYYPQFIAKKLQDGKCLPKHVQDTFDEYLRCGLVSYGFIRVRCCDCFHERLVAFSCKRRGFCPSCAAKRMTESAAMLSDEVFSGSPIRQWVFSVPYQLRLLLAREPKVLSKVLGIVQRGISSFLIKSANQVRKHASTGSVTVIQRFGSALNLNTHIHMLFLDGVYVKRAEAGNKLLVFTKIKRFTHEGIQLLTQKLSHRVLRFLEKSGFIERDIDNTYLTSDMKIFVANVSRASRMC